jgi:nicotinamidase-related amidase
MPATALDVRTALVVIDLQMGLSAFPTLAPFADVVSNATRLADAFRRAELPVVLVTITLSADGGEMLRARAEVPPRVLPRTPEFSQLAPELGSKPGDILITKRQPNAL